MQKNILQNLTEKISLRTEDTTTKYINFVKTNEKTNCIYCDRELFIKEYNHWMILENRFPYDLIAEASHMLAPKRHVALEEDLNEEEREELIDIKKNKMQDYDLILESTSNSKSKPDHFHLHLLRYHRK